MSQCGFTGKVLSSYVGCCRGDLCTSCACCCKLFVFFFLLVTVVVVVVVGFSWIFFLLIEALFETERGLVSEIGIVPDYSAVAFPVVVFGRQFPPEEPTEDERCKGQSCFFVAVWHVLSSR